MAMRRSAPHRPAPRARGKGRACDRRAVGRVPGGVCGEHQGGNPAGGGTRGLHGACAVACYVTRTPGGAHPVRHGPGQPLDVGGERRVVPDVVARMLADDVDDARLRLPRVVQVGQAIGQPGPEVQQCCGGLAGHAVVAVRGAGDHAFEQAQLAAHALHLVQRCDEGHLGRAGIGEADLDLAGNQRANQAFGSDHGRCDFGWLIAFQCADTSGSSTSAILCISGRRDGTRSLRPKSDSAPSRK